MNRRMIFLVLLIAVVPCTAKANEELISPHGMTMSDLDKKLIPEASEGPSQPTLSPACYGVDKLKHSLSQLIQEEKESKGWYSEMVKVLNQLVQANMEVAGGQAEVLKVLRVTRDQEEQQLLHLQSMARLQSLLVENNQALLLQVSRIATTVQDVAKRQRK